MFVAGIDASRNVFRLHGALEMSDVRSIRSLHRKLEERGKEPGAYSTVHRYFSGEVEEPPLSFLGPAGEILGVSAAWLAFGSTPGREGPSDPRRTAVKRSASRVSFLTLGADQVGRELLPTIVTELVLAQPPDAPQPKLREYEELAERLDKAVGELLRAVRPFLEVPGHDSWPPTGSAGATAAILGALLSYLPGHGEGYPVSEIIRMLPTPQRERTTDRDRAIQTTWRPTDG